MWRVFPLLLVLTLVSVVTHTAFANPLTGAERTALLSGDVVRRPLKTQLGQGQYFGGLSYILVKEDPAEVLSALSAPEALNHILPKMRKVDVISRKKNRALVQLTAGAGFIEAKFTTQLRWRTDADGEHGVVRFWMDERLDADISDVFGYIKVAPFDETRTLVTVGAMIDLGAGMLGMLVEDSVQKSVLNTPKHVSRYVAGRSKGRREADARRRRTDKNPS